MPKRYAFFLFELVEVMIGLALLFLFVHFFGEPVAAFLDRFTATSSVEPIVLEERQPDYVLELRP